MEAAVVRAMRDAIANIVIGFPQDAEIAAALLPDAVLPADPAVKELAAEPASAEGSTLDEQPTNDNPNDNDAPPMEAVDDEIRS